MEIAPAHASCLALAVAVVVTPAPGGPAQAQAYLARAPRALAPAHAAAAQAGGELFPSPFVVEHHVIQTAPDGTSFTGATVTDHYGASWIVSVRPDGSRVVVDLARREITEVRPDAGAYSVLGFDRLAELQQRLRRAELPSPGDQATPPGDMADPPTFAVEERPVLEGLEAHSTKSLARPVAVTRPGVRHLRVRLDQGEPEPGPPALDVWLDPSVRLLPRALDALESFETGTLGAGSDDSAVQPPQYLAAARRHAGGAFPVLTRRPASARVHASQAGAVEDVVTRLEPLERFPADLAAVPEGLRRVPHALELMVSHAEDEASLRAGVPPGAGGGS